VLTIGAALSMTAGLALAGENTVSANQILNALKPKPLTRGLSTGVQADPAATAKEASFVDTVRNRKTRSLPLDDREEVAQIPSATARTSRRIRTRRWTRPTAASRS